MTIMTFVSLDTVKEFAGDPFEEAYVPPAARAVLSRFEARSRRYEVLAAGSTD